MYWESLVKDIADKFIIFFLINLVIIHGKEEYFFDTITPNHISYKIIKLNSSIFPENLQINATLTSMSGTLLYSIDKNGNQLILTLYNEIEERIKIQFRELERFINLQKLCNIQTIDETELYKYRVIVLSIKVSSKISISCNQGKEMSFDYGKLVPVNKDYPILKKTDKVEALVYFMNTPLYDGAYPNNDQLRGCIHSVKYNGKSLNMTRSSKDVLNKCNNICLNNICNDGKCYETFSNKPICDCRFTMKNGQYCNASFENLMDKEINGNNKKFQLEYVKLVLLNTSDIVLFSMEHDDFKFFIKRERTSVNAKYEYSQNRSVEACLFKEADKVNSAVVYMKFFPKSINFQIFTGNSSVLLMPVSVNIAKAFLKSVVISSSTDIIYKKISLQYDWCGPSLDESANINTVNR